MGTESGNVTRQSTRQAIHSSNTERGWSPADLDGVLVSNYLGTGKGKSVYYPDSIDGHRVLYPGETFDEWRPPIAGESISFNGTTSTISRVESLDKDTNIIGLQFACYFRCPATAADMTLLCADGTEADAVLRITAAGEIQFERGSFSVTSTTTGLDDGEWHLVTFATTSGETRYFQIDGVEETQIVSGTEPTEYFSDDQNVTFRIGSRASSEFFAGQMSMFAFNDSYASSGVLDVGHGATARLYIDAIKPTNREMSLIYSCFFECFVMAEQNRTTLFEDSAGGGSTITGSNLTVVNTNPPPVSALNILGYSDDAGSTRVPPNLLLYPDELDANNDPLDYVGRCPFPLPVATPALSFNGTNTTAVSNVPSNTVIPNAAGNSYTLFVRFRPDDVTQTNGRLVTIFRLPSSSAAFMRIVSSNLQFGYHENGGSLVLAVTDTTLVNDTWYTACLRYDVDAGTVDVFLDGVSDVTQITGLGRSVGANTSPLQIGNNSSDYLEGDIAEAVVYKRALTDDEILSLHNDNYETYPHQDDGWAWVFQEGNGNECHDVLQQAELALTNHTWVYQTAKRSMAAVYGNAQIDLSGTRSMLPLQGSTTEWADSNFTPASATTALAKGQIGWYDRLYLNEWDAGELIAAASSSDYYQLQSSASLAPLLQEASETDHVAYSHEGYVARPEVAVFRRQLTADEQTAADAHFEQGS